MPVHCSFTTFSRPSQPKIRCSASSAAASCASQGALQASYAAPRDAAAKHLEAATVSFSNAKLAESFHVELVSATSVAECRLTISPVDGLILEMPNGQRQRWGLDRVQNWSHSPGGFMFSFTTGRETHRLAMRTRDGKAIADACMAAATSVVENLIDEETFSSGAVDGDGDALDYSSAAHLSAQGAALGGLDEPAAPQPSERGYGQVGMTDRVRPQPLQTAVRDVRTAALPLIDEREPVSERSEDPTSSRVDLQRAGHGTVENDSNRASV